MRSLMPLAFAALIAAATPVLAADDDITGVYKGEIFSGALYPGTTIFTVAPTGEISATYVFEGDGGATPGELTDCRFEERLLRCIWHDDYGSGDFVALFDPDYRAFDGAWFEDTKQGLRSSPDGGFPWSGKRTE